MSHDPMIYYFSLDFFAFFGILKQPILLNSFFMFHHMIVKCKITHWQQYPIYWQQTSLVGIYIVLIKNTS